MSTVIRPVQDGERAAFAGALATAAGRPGTTGSGDGFDLTRTLVVLDGGRIVGGTSSEPVELTAPGGAVLPSATITPAGLLPGYRGQGLAGALFEQQLPELRARGEVAAVLVTAESGAPGRFGFSPATRAASLAVDPWAARGLPAPEPGRRVWLADGEEARAAIPAIYERHRLAQPGQVSRSEDFWSGWFGDDPLRRSVPGERFAALTAGPDGRTDGYLTYRLEHGPREQPLRGLEAEDLISLTGQARRALWRYGLDFGVPVRAWNVPVDEPLRWETTSSGAVRTTAVRDFLRLRLLDVESALAGRWYGGDGAAVIEVLDPVLPQNAGSFRISAAGCEPSRDRPELTCPAGPLAAVYLGDASFAELHRAGLVTVHVAGALERADALFGTALRPWTVTDW
jgi:predicted acetyltransferase